MVRVRVEFCAGIADACELPASKSRRHVGSGGLPRRDTRLVGRVLPGVYENHNGVPSRMEEERRAVRRPVNPVTQPGDVLLRDVRVWHRGVPNPSDRPRHMIALILSKPTGDTRYPLKFGKGCEGALEGRAADPNAEYVDGPIDYLFDPSRRIFLGRVRARLARKRGAA